MVFSVVMWCHSWSGGGCGWAGWDLDGGLVTCRAGLCSVRNGTGDCGLRVVCRVLLGVNNFQEVVVMVQYAPCFGPELERLIGDR